jgi:SAM-dependent methyltransferase
MARNVLRTNARAAGAARHDYENVYLTLRRRLEEDYGPALRDVRVLDFGCGYTYPLLLLLAPDVREVVGLEVSPVRRDGFLQGLFGGGLRRPKQLVLAGLRYVEARRYHTHLRQYLRDEPPHRRLSLFRYDGEHLPFADGSFDCIISNAVLQQLPLPLEGYARQFARVLKPGGTVDLSWHNFYCWSGNYLGDDWNRRHPWDHLVGGRYDPCLNRMTPEQVVRAFGHDFTDLCLLRRDRRHRILGQDPDYRPEAEGYLTPEWQVKLARYPREWLLTNGYVLRGRRRGKPPTDGDKERGSCPLAVPELCGGGHS